MKAVSYLAGKVSYFNDSSLLHNMSPETDLSVFNDYSLTCTPHTDSKICIWHRYTGRLLEQLEGHRGGCVNAVAWNTANPSMFASAGDDHKVRM